MNPYYTWLRFIDECSGSCSYDEGLCQFHSMIYEGVKEGDAV